MGSSPLSSASWRDVIIGSRAVLKTVGRKTSGFESLSLRQNTDIVQRESTLAF